MEILIAIGLYLLYLLVVAYTNRIDNARYEEWLKTYVPEPTKEPVAEILHRRDNPTTLWKNKEEYMRSGVWYDIKQIILKRDNYTCRMCGSTNALECHHIKYDNLYNEKGEDLITVCRDCHQKIHDRYGYSYYTHYPILKD